jgi:hypothetical protein
MNNPLLVEINKLNPIRSLRVYTYIEMPKNYNLEKKIQLLSKNDSIPLFLSIALKIMKQKIDGVNTDLVVLTPQNYLKYVDDFPICMDPKSEFSLKFRVDLLSAYVLNKYGGLFLSPGTIVKNLGDILSKVNNYDLVTFGGAPEIINACNNTKFPNNYVLGSQNNNNVIRQYKKRMLDVVLNKRNVASENIGTTILSEVLNEIDCNQYHYSCDVDGTLDINKKLITIDDYLGHEEIVYKNENNLRFISLPYHMMLLNSDYKWFLNFSYDQFKSSSLFINRLILSLL